MRRLARLFLGLSIAAALAAGGVVYWGYTLFVEPGPMKGGATVVIPKGAGLKKVASVLAMAGVIERPAVFVWGVRFSGGGRAIKAGEYAFADGVSQQQVLARLIEGKTLLRRLTVPEGLTVHEVLKLVDAADGLSPRRTPPPAEGRVLPETYSYRLGNSRDAVVERMTAAMRDLLAELWAGRAADLPFDRPMEAVILASIVEKETSRSAERARIAGVFINRLRKGMRLQSDPTVVYGLTDGRGPLGRSLTRRDLETDHPYNTYKIKGLPPEPICNPGRASLEAVLHPMVTDALYFVADGTGGHVFAKTLAEHNRNVARWRRLRKGKK